MIEPGNQVFPLYLHVVCYLFLPRNKFFLNGKTQNTERENNLASIAQWRRCRPRSASILLACSRRLLDCELYLFMQFPQSEGLEHSCVKIPWFGSLLNLINCLHAYLACVVFFKCVCYVVSIWLFVIEMWKHIYIYSCVWPYISLFSSVICS